MLKFPPKASYSAPYGLPGHPPSTAGGAVVDGLALLATLLVVVIPDVAPLLIETEMLVIVIVMVDMLIVVPDTAPEGFDDEGPVDLDVDPVVDEPETD